MPMDLKRIFPERCTRIGYVAAALVGRAKRVPRVPKHSRSLAALDMTNNLFDVTRKLRKRKCVRLTTKDEVTYINKMV